MGNSDKETIGSTSTNLSRRDMLKASAVAGIGALSLGALSACSPSGDASAVSTTGNGVVDGIAWDVTVDVLAVGSSGAAYGALAAKDAGAESVLLIEKANTFGGTTSLSGGGHWTPNNYVMAEKGVNDSREDAMEYINYISMGQASEELIASYVDNSAAFLEWTRDTYGYVWDFLFSGYMYQDYGPDTIPGYRPMGRSVWIDQVATAKNVMDKDVEAGFLAAALEFQCVQYLCEQNGIEIMLGTEAVRLYQNDAGEVVGLLAKKSNGDDYNIAVNKGVILGTGGFDYNPQMCKTYLHIPYYASCMLPTCTGDGHRMGMEIGANLANMASTYGRSTVLPQEPTEPWVMFEDVMLKYNDSENKRGVPNCLTVNHKGMRIGDESAAYGNWIRAFEAWSTTTLHPENIPSYFICDATYVANYVLQGATEVGEIPEYFFKADTLDEIAAEFGIDPEGLKAQVSEFNKNAVEGRDPIWHRGEFTHDRNTAGDNNRTDVANPCLGPVETPPFYATKVYPATLGTSGGLDINGKAQVMDVNGNVIPRLFACGCTAGSPFGPAYPGGGGPVGSTCTMGYVAGRVAMGADVL